MYPLRDAQPRHSRDITHESPRIPLESGSLERISHWPEGLGFETCFHTVDGCEIHHSHHRSETLVSDSTPLQMMTPQRKYQQTMVSTMASKWCRILSIHSRNRQGVSRGKLALGIQEAMRQATRPNIFSENALQNCWQTETHF